MLSLFRTNQFVANILLIFYAFIVRLASFVLPAEPAISTGGVGYEWLMRMVDPSSKWAAFLALLLVCFQALLVNIVLSRHRMTSELTLLPGMFYVFLASCIPDFLYLSPVLLATTFYLLALSEMFDTYKKYSAADKIFNIGLWIGIGSLFYGSMVVFLLLAIIGLRSLRAFRFREQLVMACGFIAPYFLTSVYFFWIDQYDFFLERQFTNAYRFFDFQFQAGWETYLKLGFFALLILYSLFSFNRFMIKKNIQVQKNISILYWALLIAILALLFQFEAAPIHLMLLVPSLSIFLSFGFLRLSRSMAEAIHLLLLFGVLIVQYQNWWLGLG